MNDEQTNFKVTDRRLFNADGSPRDLPPEEKPERSEATSAQAGGASAVATGPSESAPSAPPEAETRSAPESTPPEDDDLLDSENPAGFVNFIMSIASNAASSLGMMEHPVTHKREVDLELAKHWIDIMGMLQQKTRGNLADQEDKILEGLLGDLRMQYVSLTKSSAAKASSALTGRDIIGG